jgi:uncharacterized protein YjbI with pentapeptide repeats
MADRPVNKRVPSGSCRRRRFLGAAWAVACGLVAGCTGLGQSRDTTVTPSPETTPVTYEIAATDASLTDGESASDAMLELDGAETVTWQTEQEPERSGRQSSASFVDYDWETITDRPTGRLLTRNGRDTVALRISNPIYDQEDATLAFSVQRRTDTTAGNTSTTENLIETVTELRSEPRLVIGGVPRPVCGDEVVKPAVSLREADLAECNLRGDDLREAVLVETTLTEATLVDADLRGATLNSADLDGADLRNADVSNVQAVRASYNGVRARDADFRDAYLHGAEFNQADVRSADFRGTYLHHVYFHEADLRDAQFEGADIYHMETDGADLDGANLEGATIRNQIKGVNTTPAQSSNETDRRQLPVESA